MKNDLVVRFYDSNRKKTDCFNFEVAGLDIEICESIKSAFSELTGHYNSRSRVQAWRSIKEFMSSLVCLKIDSSSENKNLLAEYAANLIRNNRLRKTNGSHYNTARRLVKYLVENNEKGFWYGQGLPVYDFSREEKNSRDNDISLDTLKRIAEACKKEISEIRKNTAVRKAIENGKDVIHPGLNDQQLKNLSRLIELERQEIWSQLDLAGARKGRLSSAGLRYLSTFKELTMRTSLPIYVLLMIETAANPLALMEIKLDCIESHPTDESMAFFSWEKARSNREQSLPFLKSGKYSPVELVSLLKGLTDSIRKIADPADKNLLFIVRTGRVSRRISLQSFHNQLKDFREKHSIEYFTFSDIRKAVAGLLTEEYRTIEPISKFLQHRDSKTTSIYLKGKASTQKSFERLSEFQGQMLTMLQTTTFQPNQPFTTLFGMSCHSPLDGTVSGSKKGTACLEFTSCATCKNAIVVYDDPTYVARILKAREFLERLERESHLHADKTSRFNSVFRQSLRVINESILPKVSSKTLSEAKNIYSRIPDIPTVY